MDLADIEPWFRDLQERRAAQQNKVKLLRSGKRTNKFLLIKIPANTGRDSQLPAEAGEMRIENRGEEEGGKNDRKVLFRILDEFSLRSWSRISYWG